jgi:hypothetical protein
MAASRQGAKKEVKKPKSKKKQSFKRPDPPNEYERIFLCPGNPGFYFACFAYWILTS